jgi:hypothetical protein
MSKKHPSKETRKEKKKALLSSSFAKVAVYVFLSLSSQPVEVVIFQNICCILLQGLAYEVAD